MKEAGQNTDNADALSEFAGRILAPGEIVPQGAYVDSAHVSAGSRQKRVVEYYDELASRYDRHRFGNSYGAYIDAQERRILRAWLVPVKDGKVLDLACGTGRLLDLATHGLDASEAMVRIAREKHPGKLVYCRPAIDLARFGILFDATCHQQSARPCGTWMIWRG